MYLIWSCGSVVRSEHFSDIASTLLCIRTFLIHSNVVQSEANEEKDPKSKINLDTLQTVEATPQTCDHVSQGYKQTCEPRIQANNMMNPSVG